MTPKDIIGKKTAVSCERASWDENGEKFEEYAPGDFERLFAGDFIEIEYPEGIEAYQYYTFPTPDNGCDAQQTV
jgi:hypothetical protein